MASVLMSSSKPDGVPGTGPDALHVTDGDPVVLAVPSAEDEVIGAEFRAKVDRAFEELEPREQEVVLMRADTDEHGKPKTYEQIGKAIGLSRSQAWVIGREAFAKLEWRLNDIPPWTPATDAA